MGRYITRLKRLQDNKSLLNEGAWRALAAAPVVDSVVIKAGATWTTAPDVFGRHGWPEQILWGVDQVIDVCRLVRTGNIIGAISVARAQLERWTLNIAHHHKLGFSDEEPTGALIKRAWDTYPRISAEIDMAEAWLQMSEWLHGRGGIQEALELDWMLSDLSAPNSVTAPSSAMAIYHKVCTVIEVVFRQVRGAAHVLAEETGQHGFGSALQRGYQVEELPEDDWIIKLLGPAEPVISLGETGEELRQVGLRYRYAVSSSVVRESMKKGLSQKLAIDALIERRARAVERERVAYQHEYDALGKLELGWLMARLFRYIAISEASIIASRWVVGVERTALASAAAALRSAYWLWLEDTDQAMSCVRVVLEQTCRARAWRVKPNRASRAESAGGVASPARWVEAAGWKRISVLSRALGEFAHVSPNSKWSGARKILTELQPSEDGQSEFTARGHALDSAAYLLAHEIAARFEEASTDLAQCFRQAVTLLDAADHEDDIERLLMRGLSKKDATLGDNDFDFSAFTSVT